MKIDSFVPSEEECVKKLRGLRRKDGVRCARCGSSNVKRDAVTGLNQMCQCRDCDSWDGCIRNMDSGSMLAIGKVYLPGRYDSALAWPTTR